MMTASRSLLVLGVATSLFACSGGDVEPSDASTGTQIDAMATAPDAMNSGADAMPNTGTFTLTSTAFSEGGAIPVLHTCEGDNVSPALAWTDPPAGTMSYAIVLNDTTIDFLHSVTWDIPGNVTSIPEDIDKDFEPADLPGAKQTRSYLNSRGYAGPCPPEQHTYEFKLHAIGVATLPGIGRNTARGDARTAIEAASIGSATLTGTFTPAP